MKRVIACIDRIPIWVWLFLATTQVGTLVAAPHRISDYDASILWTQNLPEFPGKDRFLAKYEKMKNEETFHIVGATILAPLFLVMGLRKWRRRRKPTSNGDTTEISAEGGHEA